MSELAFHPKAFEMVMAMPGLSPAEHIARWVTVDVLSGFGVMGWRAVFRGGGCE